MNCEQHFQHILHRIDKDATVDDCSALSHKDIIERIFKHFDTFAAMDLSKLPRQVFETIFERITAPQLRRLERYNSFIKPYTNCVWKRLYMEQFGQFYKDIEREKDTESTADGDNAAVKDGTKTVNNNNSHNNNKSGNKRAFNNWRVKYSDALDRRLLELTSAVNRLFISSITRKASNMPKADIYPDDENYDFDEDMWRTRYHRRTNGFFRGRKDTFSAENYETNEEFDGYDWRSSDESEESF